MVDVRPAQAQPRWARARRVIQGRFSERDGVFRGTSLLRRSGLVVVVVHVGSGTSACLGESERARRGAAHAVSTRATAQQVQGLQRRQHLRSDHHCRQARARRLAGYAAGRHNEELGGIDGAAHGSTGGVCSAGGNVHGRQPTAGRHLFMNERRDATLSTKPRGYTACSTQQGRGAP